MSLGHSSVKLDKEDSSGGTVDKIAGGLISFLIGYLIIYVVLLIMQLFPAGWWQMQIANSELARFMINQTPGIAHLVIDTLVQGG